MERVFPQIQEIIQHIVAFGCKHLQGTSMCIGFSPSAELLGKSLNGNHCSSRHQLRWGHGSEISQDRNGGTGWEVREKDFQNFQDLVKGLQLYM